MPSIGSTAQRRPAAGRSRQGPARSALHTLASTVVEKTHATSWRRAMARRRAARTGRARTGTVRQTGKHENGTTDAHRCTLMAPNPAWPFTADTEAAVPGEPRRGGSPCPIGVHRWFQTLACQPAAPCCRGGRSSPRAKPHAPVTGCRPPIRRGWTQAAPVLLANVRTPCTCTGCRQRIAPAATLLSRSEPAKQEPHAPIPHGAARAGPRPAHRTAATAPLHQFRPPLGETEEQAEPHAQRGSCPTHADYRLVRRHMRRS
jgi:hypothetical protein